MERLRLKKYNNLTLKQLLLILTVSLLISTIFGVIYTSEDITLSEDKIELSDTVKVDTTYLKYQIKINNLQMQLYDKELESIRRSADVERLFDIIRKLSDKNTPDSVIKEINEHYKENNYKPLN